MTLTVAADPVPLRVDRDGVARVGGTRVPLEIVLGAYLEGCTPEDIVEQYPVLRLSDVYTVIGFYLRHRAEVDEYLRQAERESAEIRRHFEAQQDREGFKQGLLARRNPRP